MHQRMSKMKLKHVIVPLIVFMALLNCSMAGGIKVYVAEGSNNGNGIDKQLDVVAKLLKKTQYKSFKFIGVSEQHEFPVNFNHKFDNGISVQCKGPADNLKVIIMYKGKQISQQTVKIGKPFIFGVPADDKNVLIILQN